MSADTLDPRPETETVIEAVLRRKPDRSAPLRILDLGTGTGCLLLALLAEYPRASGVGVDIAEGAVRTATGNAVKLGLADRARFFVGDWATAVSGRFDAIVANPPYIASGALALLPRRGRVSRSPAGSRWRRGRSCGRYRAIAEAAPRLFPPDGIFVCEIGVGQADAVAAMMRANGLIWTAIEKDLAGIDSMRDRASRAEW